MPLPSELELLKLQHERTFDERSRIRHFYGVKIASFAGRQTMWIGADVPDALAGEMASAFDGSLAAAGTEAAPPVLETCRALLATDGAPLPLRINMNYLVPEDIVGPPRIEARIVRSNAPQTNALREANPGNWEPIEWDELLDGHLGPWVMAIDGGRVASLCHTPGAPSARASECGVWTHPDFRGRGYAATVTSEWIALMRPSFEYLFYSTTTDNHSSQQVARRLGLRPIGWIWCLGRVVSDEEQGVHPLSVLRRRR